MTRIGLEDSMIDRDEDADLGITHADGVATVQDVVSTFPGTDGGDGNPRTVTVVRRLP